MQLSKFLLAAITFAIVSASPVADADADADATAKKHTTIYAPPGRGPGVPCKYC